MRACSSSVFSTTIMAWGVTSDARASAAPVMPGCWSSSTRATYWASVTPDGFRAALLARTMACSARLSAMPGR